jgi:hypothetical protein
MKQPIATCASIAGLMALGTATSSAAIVTIAGIDEWNSTAAPTVTVLATNITATAVVNSFGSGEGGANIGRGSSSDGTWGSFAGPASPSTTVTTASTNNITLFNGGASGDITITITNNNTENLVLDAFHFDALRWRPNAAKNYQIEVISGSITNGVVPGTTSELTSFGGAALTQTQHNEIDFSLAGLADHTLANGESAEIRVTFSGGTGTGSGHHLFVDNVAISGEIVPVPEPSAALLGLLGTGFFFLRRRH